MSSFAHSTRSSSSFTSVADACSYWEDQLKKCEAEFEEFRLSSREVERELDDELDSKEKEIERLKSENHRLTAQISQEKARSSRVQSEYSDHSSRVETENQKLKSELETYKSRQRELEEQLDAEQQRFRIESDRLYSVTSQMERIVERSVLVEAELEDTKRDREEVIQRLRDQVRELSEDLAIRSSVPARITFEEPAARVNSTAADVSMMDVDTPSTENSPAAGRATVTVPAAVPNSVLNEIGSPTTQSRKQNNAQAMTIVSDLLGMVEELESRLSHCRGMCKTMLQKPNGKHSIPGQENGSRSQLLAAPNVPVK